MKLEHAVKIISRHLRLYEVVPSKSNELVVYCKTSASMPFLSVSKNGILVFHDMRFFDLLHHAVLGLQFFDKNIDLPTGKTMGRFHLDSLLWTMLAERSLNINTEDISLSLGILTQESMYYEHSLKTMGAYTPQLQISGYKAFFSVEFFQAFALGHELAHLDFKIGEKWDDKDVEALFCTLKIIEHQVETLRSKSTAHPAILNMFVAVQKIRDSKTLFEELLADIASIKKLVLSEESPLISLPLNDRIEVLASTVLYGLAGTKIMTYSRAFSARNIEEFEKSWQHNHELFDARITFLAKFFSVLLYTQQELNLSESAKKTDYNISVIVYEIFELVRQAESSLRPGFDRVIELRNNGKEIIEAESLEQNAILSICATLLGWVD